MSEINVRGKHVAIGFCESPDLCTFIEIDWAFYYLNYLSSKDIMYLFFDTETTGLPRNWKAPVTHLNNWPRMIQIAWIACDDQ